MEKVDLIRARAVPLRADNVDTDQIIPRATSLRLPPTAWANGPVASWRYLDTAEANPEFVLNNPEYRGAETWWPVPYFRQRLQPGACGLGPAQYGFKGVLALSFGDISTTTSLKNGFLPVRAAQGGD